MFLQGGQICEWGPNPLENLDTRGYVFGSGFGLGSPFLLAGLPILGRPNLLGGGGVVYW